MNPLIRKFRLNRKLHWLLTDENLQLRRDAGNPCGIITPEGERLDYCHDWKLTGALIEKYDISIDRTKGSSSVSCYINLGREHSQSIAHKCVDEDVLTCVVMCLIKWLVGGTDNLNVSCLD